MRTTLTESREDRAGQRVFGFLAAFCGVFLGLALLHGFGPVYAKVHAALGNAVIHGGRLASGAELRFEANDAELLREPWRITLHVISALPEPDAYVPVDLRSLVFLPSAAFIALSIAVKLRSAREHLQLLGLGLLILEPVLLLLVSLPLLSFLGGTGPILAFRLSRTTHVILQVLYRALVAPPGMTYAIPLFLWWGMVAWLNRRESAAQREPPRAVIGDRFSKLRL